MLPIALQKWAWPDAIKNLDWEVENYPDDPFDESTMAQYMLHVWVDECSRDSSATLTPDK